MSISLCTTEREVTLLRKWGGYKIVRGVKPKTTQKNIFRYTNGSSNTTYGSNCWREAQMSSENDSFSAKIGLKENGNSNVSTKKCIKQLI